MSTLGRGLLYEGRGNTEVVGHFDADWTGSPSE